MMKGTCGARALRVAMAIVTTFVARHAYAAGSGAGDTEDEGPAMRVADADLSAAFACSGPLALAAKTPVLLVHGTSSTPEESWAFGYARVLPRLGHPTCTVRLPARAWNDMQESTEYVVYALRRMAAESGQKVSVIGHSEGTMQPLWGLRFWPDLASKVDDYIGLAPPLQGTVAAGIVCSIPGQCPVAVWQYSAGSAFISALNARPLPAGPSYTAVATYFDELVVPQPSASSMPGVTTVPVQAVCPGRLVEHAGLLGDAAAFAIVMDALDHPGPARASRISILPCFTALMPGMDVPGYALAVPVFVANFAATALTATWTAGEPPLRSYVTGLPPRP